MIETRTCCPLRPPCPPVEHIRLLQRRDESFHVGQAIEHGAQSLAPDRDEVFAGAPEVEPGDPVFGLEDEFLAASHLRKHLRVEKCIPERDHTALP